MCVCVCVCTRLQCCLSAVSRRASSKNRRGSAASNATPSNWPSDNEREKEVSEEKGRGRSMGRGSQAKGRSSLQVSWQCLSV